MKKRLFTILVFLILLSKGFLSKAQNPTYIPNYIPPSPNVAALLKFVDVPVSPYTGTSSITVPIFEIDAKGMKIPISLDYHTGGIRLAEESGMVGLGWALTAGGSISRTVMDQDDFQGDYFTNQVPQVSGDMSTSKPPYPIDNTGQFQSPDTGPYLYNFGCNYLANTTGGQMDFTNLYNNPTTIYDAEPDQFSYNFLGHTGKFIIGRNRNVIEQNQSNLKFSFDAGTYPNFMITDDEGNRFYFNNHDCNTSAAYGTCITNTWNLTQIITQLNDTVTFQYTAYSNQISVMGDITQSMVYGTTSDGFKPTNGPSVSYGNQILSSIQFRTGQVQFNYDSSRSDLKNGAKYDNIKIYSQAGTALNYLKEYDLFYSTYNPTSAVADSFENRRLILDSVKEISGTVQNPPYSFRYNLPGNLGTGALAKHGFSVDDWGYFNGISNSGLIPSESVYFNKGYPFSLIPSTWIQYSGANRSVSPFYNSTFLLNTIYYPTGGKTVMEYEGNSYDQQKSTTGPTDFPQMNLVTIQKQIDSYKIGDSTGTVDFSLIYPIAQVPQPVTNATLLLTFRCSSTPDANTLKNGTYGQVSFSFMGQNANLSVDIKDVTCSGPVCTASYPLSITAGNMIYNWDGHISSSVGSLFQDIRVTIQYDEVQQIANQITNNNYVVPGGGVRVKSVTDYSAEGKPAKKRIYQYEYTKDTNGDGIPESYSYGRLMDFPSYIRYQIMTYSSVSNISFMNISASTNTGMTSQVKNNIIGYDKIVERVVDPISNLDIGKTEYGYYNSPDSSVSYFGGYNLMGLNVMNNNLNGSLLYKIDSSVNAAGVYTKVDEVDNFYSLKNRQVYFTPRSMLPGPKLDGSRYCGGTSSNYAWLVCFYPAMKSEKLLLDSSRQYLYDQFNTASAIVNRTINYYDNPKHYQLTRAITYDSKNNAHVSFNKYPQDYLVGSNTWTSNTVMDSLIGRNMVGAVIEKRDSIYYNGALTGGKITGAQLSRYKTLSQNSMGPDKQYQLNKSGPIGDFTPFSFSGNTITQDARYQTMISFDSYDGKNNVTQFTPVDQTPVSLVWDYNSSQPVAQVKNAAIADMAFTSFEADGTGNWNLSAGGGSTSQVSVSVNAAGSNLNLFGTQTPTTVTANDHETTVGQELGVKFTSAVAGTISGIRFYKTSGNSGTHIGELYSSTGTRLAQATFTGETSTGWQTVSFTAPVSIAANTTYTAAYFSSLGNYTEEDNYFLHNSVINGVLTAPADGTNGAIGITDPGNGQGTFKYTSSAAFPNQLYEAANYWVDVIFTPSTTAFAIAGSNQTITLPTSSVVLDGSGSTGTITSYIWTKISGPGSPVIVSPTSTFSTVTGLSQGVYVFQLSLNSGASTAQVTVNVNAAGTPTNIYTTQTPVTPVENDGTAIELGVKFRTSTAGSITGIRFYKSSGNGGTHIGELYSYPGGTRLAQATFSGETTSGWQTVLFSTPVTITPNTTFVAAYWSSAGNYTTTHGFFGSPVTNGTLTGLADGTDGHNSIYKYATSAAYPSTYTVEADKPTYWVDVLFVPDNTPIPSAGSNLSVTLPVSSVTLNGSNSSGNISNYLWTKVSGPGSPVIVSPTSATTNVTGLSAGSYVFQLAVNGASNSAFALTGTKSYNMTGNTVSKSGLTSGKKYIVSYWTRGSALSIAGGTSTSTTGRSVNGWTYYEHTVTMTSTTVTITGSGYIDELRLYPQGSQMTTSLTYTPLVGVTTSNDPNSEITFYEYDSLQRLKNVKDYQGNIIKNFQYNYAGPNSCGQNCLIIPMQTFAGTNTLSYPVGVFNINGKLLGNVTNQSQYIFTWMGDTTDANTGTIVAGMDSMHFKFTANAGKSIPNGLTGCRYYQYDLPYTQIDAIRNSNGAYVDYGDGTGMRLGITISDSNVLRAPNTFINVQYVYSTGVPYIYWIHNYPDASSKTITLYHNDASERMELDNAYAPAASLILLRNLRGNLPQNTTYLGSDCNQQASAETVSSISNWNSINSVTSFGMVTGDYTNPCLHPSYSQDFMANNRNLQAIITTRGYYLEGYEDSTFKISRLKSNWNTYFTNLTTIEINDDQWNHEDLSALVNLNLVGIGAGNLLHSYNQTNNPLVPISVSVIDNIINQVAAGAGQRIYNGLLNIPSGGTNRSPASDAGLNILKAKGWTVIVNGSNL